MEEVVTESAKSVGRVGGLAVALGVGAWLASSPGLASADTGDAVAATPDTNDALVLVPLANQDYANAADQLYLEPSGFDGTAAVFITPDQGNEVADVTPGVQALVQAIEADYTAGDLSATDPLYVFGYSEGAVESGLAEQQLADFGIPSADLHFVMVGDSASAEGGFLNSFVDSFPEAQQQSITTLLDQLGVTSPLLGATTPDDLYPTDVYSFSGDGWSNYDGGANIFGMFTEHLAYLGLTPDQVASATETTDGLTNYYDIDSSNIDFTTALYNQLLISLDVSPTASATAETAATTDGDQLLLQAGQQFLDAQSTFATDLTTISTDLHTLGADLGAELFSALGTPDLLLP
jgi:hypothetical protein